MKPVFIQQPKLKGDETPEVDSLRGHSRLKQICLHEHEFEPRIIVTHSKVSFYTLQSITTSLNKR